ncbi:hypothetical protein SLEP1_g579 [Rubroshorea leprosula]|uniref:Uncharacterized protein n=1 Tax=Rubroshorea leprosula TaxID=152421 RepID=A0AAV5HAX7_9ROSI|nr:hypothetical protein SLEP1_g579 [Rubroshorea leprosula]
MERKTTRLERKGLSQRGRLRGKKRTDIREGRDSRQWRMEREGEAQHLRHLLQDPHCSWNGSRHSALQVPCQASRASRWYDFMLGMYVRCFLVCFCQWVL